jgi:hypothetical protein
MEFRTDLFGRLKMQRENKFSQPNLGQFLLQTSQVVSGEAWLATKMGPIAHFL